MSDPVRSQPRRCNCGHLESEHDLKVRPTDHYNHCSGVAFAIDQHEPDDRGQREVRCCCTSFAAADEFDLAQEQIAEIRELGRDQSLRQWQIAERYGITRSLVSTLLNGQSWAETKGQRFRPEGRICELAGCEAEVHGRRDKRFCTQDHQRVYNNRRDRAA